MYLKSHLAQYLVLMIIIFSGIYGYWYFSFNRSLRLLIIFLSVLGYVFWGLIHHYLEKRLSWSIILEYLLIGLIVIATLTLTNRF